VITVERLVERLEDFVSAVEQIEVDQRNNRVELVAELSGVREELAGVRAELRTLVESWGWIAELMQARGGG
jgi:hypothetical protein